MNWSAGRVARAWRELRERGLLEPPAALDRRREVLEHAREVLDALELLEATPASFAVLEQLEAELQDLERDVERELRDRSRRLA